MEGPTPVSALIHAATMVTAGVFLIIKCSPIFEYAPKVLTFITFVGAATAIFAATVGLVQNDLKKVIAYSTCSQLGYMIFACGLSSYHVSLFHLVNHAFFKALLFLSAGAIIHSLSNEQDMRKFGALMHLIPFTFVMILIGSLALMGFPFLTGFYSKDVILEIAYAKYTIEGNICYWVGLLAAFFTSFYSYRLFYLTFLTKSNSFRPILIKVHELPKYMAISLSFLAIGSLFFGYMSKDLLIGLGTDFWNQSILILCRNNQQLATEFIPTYIKLLPFFCSVTSVLCVIYFFENNIDLLTINTKKFIFIYKFLINKWYFDHLYNKFLAINLFIFSYKVPFKLFDKGILEFLGPNGLAYLLFYSSRYIRLTQTGNVSHYAYFIVLFLLLVNCTLQVLQ